MILLMIHFIIEKLKNDRFHKVEPNWNPIRDSNDRYYRNKKMKFICLIMNYGKRMKINHYDICDGFKSFHDEDHFLLQLLETKIIQKKQQNRSEVLLLTIRN